VRQTGRCVGPKVSRTADPPPSDRQVVQHRGCGTVITVPVQPSRYLALIQCFVCDGKIACIWRRRSGILMRTRALAFPVLADVIFGDVAVRQTGRYVCFKAGWTADSTASHRQLVVHSSDGAVLTCPVQPLRYLTLV